MNTIFMQSLKYSDEEWLDRMLSKSDSVRTKNSAKTSLNMFRNFCKIQNISQEKIIEQYQSWANQGDVRSIGLSLSKFVRFLSKDEPTLVINQLTGLTHKKKNPKTIRVYLSFLKSYLRLCHGVKLTTEDYRDYVEIPTPRKEPRKPILLDQLKAIMNNASAQRKALYYLLVTSGMRLGEALTLTKENFHTDENPIRISIDAETTKTKEARETYITSEAFEKIKPVLSVKKNDELLFTHIKEIAYAVSHEDRRFADLREKLGYTEKYKSANRYVVTLHAFRAYFHTKASQKLGSEAANALDGHSGYLSQYYRQDPKERANKYLELEPELLIESKMIESKGRKDQVIKNLEDTVEKLQAKMLRFELLNQ